MEQLESHQPQTHFRLKLGTAEIEFTGAAEFLKNEIMPAVNRIVAAAETSLKSPEDNEPKQIAGASFDSTSFIGNIQSDDVAVGSLASYIKHHNAESNQVRRFLVVADWLRRRGQKLAKPGEIAVALRAHQQSKLANPADCLNKNVAKGYFEKTTDGFFITPEGHNSLGSSDA